MAQPARGPPAPPPGDADDMPDPRQLSAQIQLVQRELARTQERLEAIESALVEANQAAATVRALTELPDNDKQNGAQVLVPVGGGVHVHARLVPGTQPVVPIGSGYAIEASPQAALATLERRIQDITESFNRTADRADELAQAGAQMNSILARMMGEEA